MESEDQRLLQLLMDYWIAYYSEIRKEIPNYTSDPTSKQIPVMFRTHERHLEIFRFVDGYVVVRRTVPEEERHQAGYWETFHTHEPQNQTVGAATGRGYPPYGDFMESDSMLLARAVQNGEYADPMPPERIEGRDYISINNVAVLTQDKAREEARKDLREALAQS